MFPKRFKTTTLRSNADSYPEDLTSRAWDKGAVNQIWIGDIPYLRTWEGWLYLATVIDAHSRRVVGWAIDETMTADLVQDALSMAVNLRENLPERVIFHTDYAEEITKPRIGVPVLVAG